MTAKQRLLTALARQRPDRLPVTTHHVMPTFLARYMPGLGNDAFFATIGLDPIHWIQAHRSDPGLSEAIDPDHTPGYLEAQRLCSSRWRVSAEPVPHPEFATTRYTFHTPHRTLAMVVQSHEHTSWVVERLIKTPSDIDALAAHLTRPICDTAAVVEAAARYGETAMIRGFVNGFDIAGQPGCWQDACVLVGVEALILATYDDPAWVHALLGILRDRKAHFIDSLRGAPYDLVELGGGDASSTVISPDLFDRFVAPYDRTLVDRAHAAGQRVVYHTCGGMMPILERIADLGVDAMETFTPPGLGGDARLAEAKQRIGGRVCLIGGLDQSRYFLQSTATETRAAVRRLFEEAGEGGGYILAPSDHFFDARIDLLHAFADEARRCVYA